MVGSMDGLRKGAWTAEEDCLLKKCIDKYGEGKWHQVPLRAGLNRCRKSCRLRWLNYLAPNIKRGKFASDEIDLLLRLYKLLGNRWSLIAGRLPGRTANDVKNYFNTKLGKKHELLCKAKMKNRNITCSPSTPTHEISKPQPRYVSVNNEYGQLNSLSEVNLIGNVNDKDEKKDEFVNTLMDIGENMWWENMLEERQKVDAVGCSTTATDEVDSYLMNPSSPPFDVENLWNDQLNVDVGEVGWFSTQ